MLRAAPGTTRPPYHPGKQWRTGDGAPYKAGKIQHPPATPAAMPRQRRAGPRRYTAPGSDAAAAASGWERAGRGLTAVGVGLWT